MLKLPCLHQQTQTSQARQQQRESLISQTLIFGKQRGVGRERVGGERVGVGGQQSCKVWNFKLREYRPATHGQPSINIRKLSVAFDHSLSFSTNLSTSLSSKPPPSSSSSSQLPPLEQYYRKQIHHNGSPDLLSFISQLAHHNVLFSKINSVIATAILRIGRIRIYSQGEIIHGEAAIIKCIGIVLWGQISLWSKNVKMRCFPGDSVDEECVFERSNYRHEQYDSLGKVWRSGERIKAYCPCAVLFIDVCDYVELYAELAKKGLKGAFLLLENILKMSYLRKVKRRSQ